MKKLDYRCRAIGCTQGNHCRRFITGREAASSAIPFAAFDTRRDTVNCDGFLPRIMAPMVIETEGGSAD